MELTLLHLSDIHFKQLKGHEYLDVDKDIQNELEFDLKRLKAEYNLVNAILIGGDIAFSGQETEYIEADTWIGRICEIVGCMQENVLTIPGNHDVDWSKHSPVVKDVHDVFKKLKQRTEIDDKIAKYLTSDDSSNILLGSFTNYHSFAQKYGCVPKDNNLLFWIKDFVLGEYILRIRGVNSALVSNKYDDENTSKLVIGSHQSLIPNEPGVINVVLCHHPPQWLIDGDDAHRDFRARARICLFGHKHYYDVEKLDDKCLILAAGAMQPPRGEADWEPRYNVIKVQVTKATEQAYLNVRLIKRIWDKREKKFTAERSENGSLYVEFDLKLTTEEAKPIVSNSSSGNGSQNGLAMAEQVIDLNNPNPIRKLAFMFLGLPYHSRVTIAAEMKLIEDSDKALNEVQKAQICFKRVIDRKQLGDLWDKVMKVTSQSLENPFKK